MLQRSRQFGWITVGMRKKKTNEKKVEPFLFIVVDWWVVLSFWLFGGWCGRTVVNGEIVDDERGLTTTASESTLSDY